MHVKLTHTHTEVPYALKLLACMRAHTDCSSSHLQEPQGRKYLNYSSTRAVRGILHLIFPPAWKQEARSSGTQIREEMGATDLINKHLLSTDYVPRPNLGTWDSSINQRENHSLPWGSACCSKETVINNKQIKQVHCVAMSDVSWDKHYEKEKVEQGKGD